MKVKSCSPVPTMTSLWTMKLRLQTWVSLPGPSMTTRRQRRFLPLRSMAMNFPRLLVRGQTGHEAGQHRHARLRTALGETQLELRQHRRADLPQLPLRNVELAQHLLCQQHSSHHNNTSSLAPNSELGGGKSAHVLNPFVNKICRDRGVFEGAPPGVPKMFARGDPYDLPEISDFGGFRPPRNGSAPPENCSQRRPCAETCLGARQIWNFISYEPSV